MMIRLPFVFLLCVFALSFGGGGTQVSAEELMDPLEAHMRARRQVDPRDTKSYHPYTSKTNPYKKTGRSSSKTTRTRTSDKIVRKRVQVSKRVSPVIPLSGVPIPRAKPVLEAIDWNEVSVAVAEPIEPSSVPIPEKKVLVAHAPEAPVESLGDVDTKSLLRKKPTYKGLPYNHDVTLTDIRVGDHSKKTRIVFDLDNGVDYAYALDKLNRTLLVELKGVSWGTQLEKAYGDHPLIQSYRADDQQDGSSVQMSFKKRVKVVSVLSYPPSDQYKAYRIVIDVTKK